MREVLLENFTTQLFVEKKIDEAMKNRQKSYIELLIANFVLSVGLLSFCAKLVKSQTDNSVSISGN